MYLPEAFLSRMKGQLGEEYHAFVSSYDKNSAYGLRVNELKGAVDDIIPALPFSLRQIPWAAAGFFAEPASHPGRHPLHEAGVYYIQEPSAMSVVTLLNPKPDETICDLCAAPGGKSTQIASQMQGRGLLVTNEIVPNRSGILSQNIERMGITNALVCNETPERMASHFPLFFDRIVVDAPCSGEGMFRKDDNAISEWSPEQVEICRERQAMILEYADAMLKPNGVLVYSTCTFAPEEDEEQVSHFLSAHSEYQIEPWQDYLRADCGITDGSITGTMRLYPHKLEGEGHFAVRLRKGGNSADRHANFPKPANHRKRPPKKQKKNLLDLSDFWDFTKQTLSDMPFNGQDTFQFFGDELYRIPSGITSLDGIKTVRAGLHLGTRKKNRFEPAHALAKALSPHQVPHYDCSEEEAVRYLHGETLSALTEDALPDMSLQGWIVICYKQFPLGWAKANRGVLKNHYPKGLRVMY